MSDSTKLVFTAEQTAAFVGVLKRHGTLAEIEDKLREHTHLINTFGGFERVLLTCEQRVKNMVYHKIHNKDQRVQAKADRNTVARQEQEMIVMKNQIAKLMAAQKS